MSDVESDAPAYQVRFHGRGGQGAVTAAQICMIAFEGKGMCVPNFGAERMGASVMSFARMSKDMDLKLLKKHLFLILKLNFRE